MKLKRQSILWVLMVISLGVLLGSLLIYVDYTNRADEYDMEVLKQYEEYEAEQTGETETEPEPEPMIEETDEPEGKVYAGEVYGKRLVAEDSRNVLIIGEDKENKLYDTIGIASIDSKSKKVSIIMIPRDLYVDYSKSVSKVISNAGKTKTPGIYKLNTAHYIGALAGYKGKFKSSSISFLAEVIKQKFGIDVDDYVKINVEGFSQVVDLFGGIDLNIPYDMNYDDPVQDLHIHLEKGMKHLDGKQAEGFVRFRQGYRDDGTRFDVDRKTNQITFIKEFIKQHGTISNINKIPELLNTFSSNVKHSIGFGDILLTYTSLAKDVINDKYIIEDINLNGENKIINGTSYIIIR